MTATPSASVGRNSALMAAGTLVSRVLGLVRTALLTAAIGTWLSADAFGVANQLPNFIYILLSAGVLNAVLIPQITKAMGPQGAGQEFVDRLITASLLLVVGVAVAATVASPWILALTTQLPGQYHQLAVAFGLICVPQIAFYGLYAVLGQVLNARDQFAAFMWTPVLANVVQIAGLVGFLVMWGPVGRNPTWTGGMIWLLAGTSTLGIAVQGLALIIPLHRGGFRYRPRFGFRGRGLSAASRILGWTFTALVIAQLGGFFIQYAMTAIRGDSETIPSVATQQTAFLVFMLPHSFVTTSILTALFPQFSRAFAANNLDEVKALIRQGMSLPAVAIIPMSFGVMAMALQVVEVLFPGMPSNQEQDVAWVVTAMAVGTMAFGLTTLQQRYCFAREDGRTNLALQALLTAVQVGFGVLAFAMPARWGVVTIAIGQTVANTVTAIAFLVVARRQLGTLGLSEVWRLYVRLTIASAIPGVITFVILQNSMFLYRVIESSFMVHLVQLATGGLVFLGIFFALVKLFHIREVDALVAPLLRRLPFRRA